MFEFNWKYFSNLSHIKKLPMNEQKKLFKAEQLKRQQQETYTQMRINVR